MGAVTNAETISKGKLAHDKPAPAHGDTIVALDDEVIMSIELDPSKLVTLPHEQACDIS